MLNLTFQDLEWVRPKIQKAFKNNSKRSLSALFRRIRKSSEISFIGDFPIMSLILEEALKAHVKVTKKVFWRLSFQSEEYQENKSKTSWQRSLILTANGGNEIE